MTCSALLQTGGTGKLPSVESQRASVESHGPAHGSWATPRGHQGTRRRVPETLATSPESRDRVLRILVRASDYPCLPLADPLPGVHVAT